jgi:hypothetical protein
MSDLADITSPTAIRKAMTEYDGIGQGAFLEKYGFRLDSLGFDVVALHTQVGSLGNPVIGLQSYPSRLGS